LSAKGGILLGTVCAHFSYLYVFELKNKMRLSKPIDVRFL